MPYRYMGFRNVFFLKVEHVLLFYFQSSMVSVVGQGQGHHVMYKVRDTESNVSLGKVIFLRSCVREV